MSELEKQLEELLERASELTGEHFEFAEDAIDFLNDSDDDEWD